MKRLSIIFLLLLVPALAFGATTWTTAVTQDGAGGACEDGGECSVAEFNALSGDYSNSVFYFSGTFTSTVDVGISGTLDNEVILDGYETDNTTYQNLSEATGRAKIDVTTSLAGIAIDGGDYIEVVDFEITDFDQAIRVALTTESNDITIKRCYMYEGSNGIYFGSASYNITIGGSSGNGNVIKNIGTTTAGEDIALGQNTHDIIISYNHLYADSSSWGIDGIMSLGSDDVLVEYNSIHEHNKTVNLGENGIDLKRNCSDWIIRYNDIYGHNEQGIEIILNGSALGSADRIYIYGNRIHDGDVYALMAQYDAAAQFDDIYIFSNLIYGFDRDGINISNKGTFTIFNNTISENAATPVNTHDLGVYIGGGAGAIVLKNNILIKNRPNESDYRQYELTAGKDELTTADYNRFYWPSQTIIIDWGDAGDSLTLAQVQGGSGNGLPQETNSSEGDPGLVDWANADYRIALGGAVIDGAVDMGSGAIATITIQGTDYAVNWDVAFGPDTDWSGIIPVIDELARDSIGWDQGAYGYESAPDPPSQLLIIKVN